MKKLCIIIVIIGFLGTLNRINILERSKDFPHEDTFDLEISCEERIALGETANISVTFSNNGNSDYDINFHNNLFKVLVDEEAAPDIENSTSTILLYDHATTGTTLAVVPDKIGVCEIKVIVAFEIKLPSGGTKEYYYQKTISINVTE